jgi:hypothetical protein
MRAVGKMLPSYGSPREGLPRRLNFIRHLEYYEGPILSEYRASAGSAWYIEKWCARDGGINRFLVVRTEQRAVAEYLGGRISMLDLLSIPSDGVGFLVDRKRAEVVGVSLVNLAELPPKYLPTPTALHDESLRPEWDLTPQNFLLDTTWDAHLLARIERRYLDVFGFAYVTKPGTATEFPRTALDYEYDGGYSLMHAFNRIRAAVPTQYQARSVGVAASSPGVLTIDAPTGTADHLAAALRAVEPSAKIYDVLHQWSRINPKRLARSPATARLIPTTARDHLGRLCEFLGVDVEKILPFAQPDPLQILVAAKLVASYRRRLLKIVSPDEPGVEFLGAQPSVSEQVADEAALDEDEDELVDLDDEADDE